MQPFIDLRALTPPPGRLKCHWVHGADGRLESVWVLDRELDEAFPEHEAAEPLQKTG